MDVLAHGIIVNRSSANTYVSSAEQLDSIRRQLSEKRGVEPEPLSPLQFKEVVSTNPALVSSTYPSTTHAHVLWVQRGKVRFRTPQVDCELLRGAWIYIPAGIEFSVEYGTAEYVVTLVDN